MLRVEFIIQRYFYDILKAEIGKKWNKFRIFVHYKPEIWFKICQSFPGLEKSFLYEFLHCTKYSVFLSMILLVKPVATITCAVISRGSLGKLLNRYAVIVGQIKFLELKCFWSAWQSDNLLKCAENFGQPSWFRIFRTDCNINSPAPSNAEGNIS